MYYIPYIQDIEKFGAVIGKFKDLRQLTYSFEYICSYLAIIFTMLTGMTTWSTPSTA
jgi:hypothetical protein